MTTLAQDLGGVVRLLEKATPDWRAYPHGVIRSGLFHEYVNGSAQLQNAMFTGELRDEDRDAAVAAVNFLRTHSAEIAGALRDAERLDWLASGEQKMLERSIDGQWFRVYRDVAAPDAEHAEWSAMTEAHFNTARAAIDSAMQQGGGGGE